MPRQRSTPWIYRWSRLLMAGIACIGAVVTGYLTIIKLMGNASACPTDGCDIVLSSPYATVFGLPLALFGFLAYVGMIILAIAPLLVQPPRLALFLEPARRQSVSQLETWTGLLLFIGATAMMVFSGYLLYLLAFKIKSVCIYCIGSALLSTSLFILAVLGRQWQDKGQLVFTGTVVGLLVLFGALGIYAPNNNPAIAEAGAGQSAPGYTITTNSGQAEIDLAKHLTQVGAKFYGAFWCPHCQEQKQLFGKQAAQFIPYVECSTPDGQGQTEICQRQKIASYPTWEIKGQRKMGEKSLEELSKLSDYQGLRNFKNSLSK